ncbi:acyl-CoA dehydrogenase family protein [Goodfellowiella coeruleoviolacea]|uniref:Acyl-CoA dehydrogenase, N-terminal domain n=1 Tax=Goodfellowiella coeruleoviolacea TaxID=334858 RepID=A0AAE3GGJ7_9PSEU|nr:acyl-CoA dehydrogenase family protein [Goodfellowiella coeruleoviolacea]MCP2167861.1 Acyl-CoA dehydrogenase, N-terminal domain [Goodfellowiella coeruleoviolacea]
MTATIDLAAHRPGDAELRLRDEVRQFLADQRAAGAFRPRSDAWMSAADPAFSRRLGARGWLGMTLPARYGGHDRSPLERFAVVEELLAAGAPVAAHWIADRQMAPAILRNGTEEQRLRYLPGIARGGTDGTSTADGVTRVVTVLNRFGRMADVHSPEHRGPARRPAP